MTNHVDEVISKMELDLSNTRRMQEEINRLESYLAQQKSAFSNKLCYSFSKHVQDKIDEAYNGKKINLNINGVSVELNANHCAMEIDNDNYTRQPERWSPMIFRWMIRYGQTACNFLCISGDRLQVAREVFEIDASTVKEKVERKERCSYPTGWAYPSLQAVEAWLRKHSIIETVETTQLSRSWQEVSVKKKVKRLEYEAVTHSRGVKDNPCSQVKFFYPSGSDFRKSAEFATKRSALEDYMVKRKIIEEIIEDDDLHFNGEKRGGFIYKFKMIDPSK